MEAKQQRVFYEISFCFLLAVLLLLGKDGASMAALFCIYHEQVSHMRSGMISFMAEVVENRDDNTGGHIRRTAK